MKIVKEHINEIKIGAGNSGLDSIGVGKTYIDKYSTKTYDLLVQKYPEKIKYMSLTSIIVSENLKSILKDIATMHHRTLKNLKYEVIYTSPTHLMKLFDHIIKNDPNTIKKVHSTIPDILVESITSIEWGLTILYWPSEPNKVTKKICVVKIPLN